MVVDDLYVSWPIRCPPEADSKLIIDPDGMLTRAISDERFEPVTRRQPQIAEIDRNDLCPCGSGSRFQGLLYEVGPP
jgi:hypothetical protein